MPSTYFDYVYEHVWLVFFGDEARLEWISHFLALGILKIPQENNLSPSSG